VAPKSSVLLFECGDHWFKWDLQNDPPRRNDRFGLGDALIRLAKDPSQRGNEVTFIFDILHGRFVIEDVSELSRLKARLNLRTGEIQFGSVKQETPREDVYLPPQHRPASRIDSFERRYPNWRRQIG
jgi:hypothetical protein